MEIINFKLNEVDHEKIKYVVMIAEYEGKLVIIKNKNKSLWEMPGGKREEGQQLLKAASRELFEETGAVQFELVPYGVYLMNGSYGMNIYAKITEIGPLPDYEIQEIRFCETLPDGLDYGDIYYTMYEEWCQIEDKTPFVKYKIDYKPIINRIQFH